MDRFIVRNCYDSYKMLRNLKSNMDRFIVVSCFRH